jgi:5-methylcytosine-specific restriction endonuclease McrA
MGQLHLRGRRRILGSRGSRDLEGCEEGGRVWLHCRFLMPSNKALQLPGLASRSAERGPMPRRRGLRPHLLAAVLRLRGNVALGPQLNARSGGQGEATRMICQWCKRAIEFDDCGKSCPGITGTHRPDNRHAPLGKNCPCGRRFEEHRVAHEPKGDPCTTCNLPATSHITRKALNLPKDREALRARDGWRCMLCGDAFSDPAPPYPDPMSVTVDHIQTNWRGGSKDLANLRLAHNKCNMKRGGDGLSPAQKDRDQRAADAWRRRLGASAATMTDAEVKAAAFAEILKTATKRRASKPNEQAPPPNKALHQTGRRPARR